VTVSLEDVQTAAARIADDVVLTPMQRSGTLSQMLGAEICLKFENLQFTGSFKDRGSANHLRSLSAADRERGVIALSAGNHAQGVAYHSARMGIKATVVMPTSAPFSKVANTEALGASVVQYGTTLYESREKVDELQEAQGLRYVHPYDDRSVIAGQGTIGLEMLAAEPSLECLLVPVGGGGLISGIAVAVKALRPDVEVIGVQIESYNSVAAAFTGSTEPPAEGDTLADGIAVKSLGKATFELIERLVDDVVTVSEEDTERALVLLLEIEKTVVEGAGAVGLAAVIADPERFAGRNVGLVLSGGNIDSRVLASVLMRGMIRSGRIISLRIRLRDQPGQLLSVIDAVAAAGASVVEVHHRRLFDPISARSSNVDVVMEVRDGIHAEVVIGALRQAGHQVDQIS